LGYILFARIYPELPRLNFYLVLAQVLQVLPAPLLEVPLVSATLLIECSPPALKSLETS
jgi:hypothetical protein